LNSTLAVEVFGESKASTFLDPDAWNRTAPVIVPQGQDTRFLYPNLQSSGVGPESAVHDFKQTARTLTGSPQRALDATSDKASVDVTLASVTEELSQFAVVLPDIPNGVLESVASLRAFLESEGAFQVHKASMRTPF
jgi:hypothetical protein